MFIKKNVPLRAVIASLMLAQPRPAQPVLALKVMYTFRIGQSQARTVNKTKNEEKQLEHAALGPKKCGQGRSTPSRKRLPSRHRFRVKNYVDDVNVRNNPDDYKQGAVWRRKRAAWPALTPVGHGEQNQFRRLNAFRRREGFDTASQIKQDGVPKANLLAI